MAIVTMTKDEEEFKRPRSKKQQIASKRNWCKGRLIGFTNLNCKLTPREYRLLEDIETAIEGLLKNWDINTSLFLDED